MFNKSMMKGKAGVTKPPRPNIGRKHTTDKVKQQVYVHWHKNKLKEKMPGQPLGIEPKACISYMYVFCIQFSFLQEAHLAVSVCGTHCSR